MKKLLSAHGGQEVNARATSGGLMKRLSVTAAAALVLVPGLAFAHVTVRPRGTGRPARR